MTQDDVTRDLLRSVSRTFYLSVHILPAALREIMGVAYLLARTSDTIADAEGAPIATRLRRLLDFGTIIQAGRNPVAVASIQRDIKPGDKGEAALIAALPVVIERFGSFKPWEWKETQDLLNNIVRGQTNDLRTFHDPENVIPLPDADSLTDYIYLVAGCVGEWWTRVCLHSFPNYSRIPERDLVPFAAAFGKGLQLVNILRDMPVDLRAGRCYLPEDELREAGIDVGLLRELPATAQPVFDRWLAKARTYLDQGREYILAIRPWRVRIACYIPWKLAVRTLDLMSVTSPLDETGKVKVARSAVYGTILRSLLAAVSNKAVT